MSLLTRVRIPSLRSVATRVHPTASFSSTPWASSATRAEIEDDPFRYQVDYGLEKKPSQSRVFDDLPPAAPATAYAPPRPTPPNPLRQTVEEKPHSSRPFYRVYVKATRNNCIITFTQPNGDPIRTFSGGMFGFKHVQRSTHEAAHQCAVHAFESIKAIVEKEPTMLIHLYMNGFGKGREAVQKAFLSTEGGGVKDLVFRVTDKTPIQIGGNRAKKQRRL